MVVFANGDNNGVTTTTNTITEVMMVSGDDDHQQQQQKQQQMEQDSDTNSSTVMMILNSVTTPSPSQPSGDDCSGIGSHFLPLPPQLDLHVALTEAVALESKYQASLSLSMYTRNMHEITGRMRNGSCHVLRCLKVWYELPSDTFFLAVNTMDRFLTRMKAQPKHLSCIAVSAFHVACEESAVLTGRPVPSRDSVSAISQSKCTSGDVSRMEDIIRTKLELTAATGDSTGMDQSPVTPLTVMRLIHAGLEQLLSQHLPRECESLLCPPPLLPLVHKLEVVVCDTRASNYRATEVAMALLRRELTAAHPANATLVTACLQPLMLLCKINHSVLSQCEDVVHNVLQEYETPGRGGEAYHRQRLVWKVSNRTLRTLRPMDRLKKYARLPTIVETKCDRSLGYVAAATHRLSSAELRMRSRCGAMFWYNDHDLEEEADSDIEQDEEETVVCREVVDTLMESDYAEIERAILQEEQQPVIIDGYLDEIMETNEEELEHQTEDEDLLLPNVVLDDTCDDSSEEKMDQDTEAVIISNVREAGQTVHTSNCEHVEVSYSQVAKKMREDRKEVRRNKDILYRLPGLPLNLANTSSASANVSPNSKLQLTSAIESPRPSLRSPACRNLSRLLHEAADDDSVESAYTHHGSIVLHISDVLGDCDSVPSIQEQLVTSPNFARTKHGKRKQRLRLQLFTPNSLVSSGDGSDSEMTSEHASSSSSEEEMDSDYEKEFPPLPLPRTSHRQQQQQQLQQELQQQQRIVRKKAPSQTIKKKKKPDVTKSKAMRKMHVRKKVQK